MNNLNPLYEIVTLYRQTKRIAPDIEALAKGYPLPRKNGSVLYRGDFTSMDQLLSGKTKDGYLSNKLARRFGIDPAAIGSKENSAVKSILAPDGPYVEKIAGQNLRRRLLSNLGSLRRIK